MSASFDASGPGGARAEERLWVERLALANFRNYTALSLDFGPEPVVLVGPNGSGKTNILEAISLLAPGQGLRQAPYADLARAGGDGSWSVFARVHTGVAPVEIGTGLAPNSAVPERTGRIVRIDGEAKGSSGALAGLIELVWLTPAMDGLFTGAASERRRFLDRLILCFDPAHRTRIGHFDKAMASRNRLLAEGVRDSARLEGFEIVMAETGIAISAARAEAVAALAAVTAKRLARDPASPFPWSTITLDGALERDLAARAAVDVEDGYLQTLIGARERDRAAGRTLDGPHRSDLSVEHGPKGLPARLCSTGEQKALLMGLVLAHAELVRERQGGRAPLLLLDEVTAHLDADRRAALFVEILRLGSQAFMTGTDFQPFAVLAGRARALRLSDGIVTPIDP